jgi:hypothetical protein
MFWLASLMIGFATGWAVRGTTDSPRSAALAVVAAALDATTRLKRGVAIERDHLEDLVAEARARVDMRRYERALRTRTSPAWRRRDAAA